MPLSVSTRGESRRFPLVVPFRGLRPQPDLASRVAAPPYDVLNRDEAYDWAHDNPLSFLHVSMAEIDLPKDTDKYAPVIYDKAAENLARMVDDEVLIRDDTPCYYIYRLIRGSHVQTGVVVAASLDAYARGVIRKHELTRPEKEIDRVRQIQAVGAQTGPVFLVHHPLAALTAVLEAHTTTHEALYDVVAADGVRHQMWLVRKDESVQTLDVAMNQLDQLYIADGHHRSAAALEEARQRRGTTPGENGIDDHFLAVLFPTDQVQLLDYNRVVTDLNGLSDKQFLEALTNSFSVTPTQTIAKPTQTGNFGLYLGGQWYNLTLTRDLPPPDNPVARLDVSLLTDHILSPILGISDLRRDPRIDFVGGIRGLATLEQRVDAGNMVAAFALYPTAMDDLLAVADANQIMPPKSTWFEPKLADGLVSLMLTA